MKIERTRENNNKSMQMSKQAVRKQQQRHAKRMPTWGLLGGDEKRKPEKEGKQASEKKHEHKAKTITRKRLFMVTLSRKDKPRRKKTETNKYAQNVYPIYLDKSTAKWH